jgi:hypothetical protein
MKKNVPVNAGLAVIFLAGRHWRKQRRFSRWGPSVISVRSRSGCVMTPPYQASYDLLLGVASTRLRMLQGLPAYSGTIHFLCPFGV